MVNIKTKLDHCQYREGCSFYGAVKCKDKQWGNPSECILYQLTEDVQELKSVVVR